VGLSPPASRLVVPPDPPKDPATTAIRPFNRGSFLCGVSAAALTTSVRARATGAVGSRTRRRLPPGRAPRHGLRAAARRLDTVKVDGLPPGQRLHYRFSAQGRSIGGRTRTLPVGPTAQARFAVFSCSNYPAGHFLAYAEAARVEDLDAAIHLGDYIYEYGIDGYASQDAAALGRLSDPVHETVTLADHHRRYAQYRSDPDLQALHAGGADDRRLGRPRTDQRRLARRRAEPPARDRGLVRRAQGRRGARLPRVDAHPRDRPAAPGRDLPLVGLGRAGRPADARHAAGRARAVNCRIQV